MVSGVLLSIGVYVHSRFSPSRFVTSPQMNFTPIFHSRTGWDMKVSGPRWSGWTKARRMPGVYSKYSFASIRVTLVVAHVASDDEAGKATPNDQHAALGHFSLTRTKYPQLE